MTDESPAHLAEDEAAQLRRDLLAGTAGRVHAQRQPDGTWIVRRLPPLPGDDDDAEHTNPDPT